MIEVSPNNPYDIFNEYHIFKVGYLYDEESIRNHIKNKRINSLKNRLELCCFFR